jgi:hypothetical protein
MLAVIAQKFVGGTPINYKRLSLPNEAWSLLCTCGQESRGISGIQR